MKSFVPYLITAGVGISVTLLVALTRGGFTETDLQIQMQIWSDACFATGVFLTCGGLIVVASNGGVFDMFGYSMTLLLSVFLSSKVKRKYKTFYDYRESKKEKKLSFSYVLIVGLCFIAFAGAFLIAYYNVG